MTHASPTKAPRPSLRRGLNRKGAIGVAFAIAASAVLGMGALATEAGVWLTQRRNAQAAADSAAFAGAIVLQQRGTAPVELAATQMVNRNGFVAGPGVDIRIETGQWSGGAFTAGDANPNAVRAQVWQTQSIGLARLISSTAPRAWGGAVAAIQVVGDACILSRVDRTIISGNENTFAPGCVIASNNSTDKSVWIRGGATVTADGVVTLGNCAGCTNVRATLGFTRPGVRTTDPYEDINNYVDGRLGVRPNLSSNCVAPQYTGGSQTRNNYVTARLDNARNAPGTDLPSSATVRVVCQEISINTGNELILTPGIYVFYRSGNNWQNAGDLTMNGGAIRCEGCDVTTGAGVTLIFTGNAPDEVATLRVTGGNFNLNAQRGNPTSPMPLDGVLIYRDDLNQGDTGSRSMILTGNGSSSVWGAIYAPTSQFGMVGTSLLNTTAIKDDEDKPIGCTPVIAQGITLNGTSGVDVRGCSEINTDTSKVLIVDLVQ